MASQPQDSLPQAAGAWKHAVAAYRFLNNDRVDPAAVQTPVIEHTRRLCAQRAAVLCVHDLSPIDPVYKVSGTKLYQHSVLAVDGGEQPTVLGLLHQRWFDDPKAPPGETRRQRRQRWTRSQAWPEAIEAVGAAPADSRWITVADREADDFQVFHACRDHRQGFVIRSQHDRYLIEGDRLRERMRRQPVIGGAYVPMVSRAAMGIKSPPGRRRSARASRTARVQIRCASLALAPPQSDDRYDQALAVNAVWVHESAPPADAEPLDWLLLTSEPVTTLAEALEVIDWYTRRWRIEELHKAQKTGCGLEKSQLHTPEAIQRLAAISAVVAVRLLQLRDAADDPPTGEQVALDHYDGLWVQVVARLVGCATGQLSVRQFFHGIARQGGWLGRKNDGPPGWLTLWRGWRVVSDYVTGIELLRESPPGKCV